MPAAEHACNTKKIIILDGRLVYIRTYLYLNMVTHRRHFSWKIILRECSVQRVTLLHTQQNVFPTYAYTIYIYYCTYPSKYDEIYFYKQDDVLLYNLVINFHCYGFVSSLSLYFPAHALRRTREYVSVKFN